jgi:hypothetical protein
LNKIGDWKINHVPIETIILAVVVLKNTTAFCCCCNSSSGAVAVLEQANNTKYRDIINTFLYKAKGSTFYKHSAPVIFHEAIERAIAMLLLQLKKNKTRRNRHRRNDDYYDDTTANEDDGDDGDDDNENDVVDIDKSTPMILVRTVLDLIINICTSGILATKTQVMILKDKHQIDLNGTLEWVRCIKKNEMK